MNFRLSFLAVILLLGFSSIFFLPSSPALQQSAVRMKLPNVMAMTGWTGGPDAVDFSIERSKLADDTEFRRKDYYHPSEKGDGSLDVLQTTIVLSGMDMNNSLHRPERCLPGQGFIVRQTNSLDVPLSNGKTVKVTRLICDGTEAKSQTSYTHMNYYFFVGKETVSGSHWGRTFQDIRDRLVGGYDQRWAYVTVGMNLVDTMVQDPSGNRYVSRKKTEAEADAMVTAFISEMVPELVDLSAIKNWD